MDTLADMDLRFDSLRSYGRLPQGRENRGRALTNEQIVAAVLGLVAAQPRWAGHVATIIAKLKPVGAKTDTFGGAVTLTDAFSQLLSESQCGKALLQCESQWRKLEQIAMGWR